MTSSQSQNPYVYCMNNPLRYIDPTGMMGDIPRMSLDEWLGPSYRSASDLLNEMRASQEYFSGLIMEAYHDIMFGSGDYNYQNYDNLNPVLSDRQNPIGAHVYGSGPLYSANAYGLYNSETKELDASLHFKLLGDMSTPGAGVTLIDLDVSIDKFKSITKTFSGSIEIPIAKTGYNIVIDKAYYDEDEGGTITTHRLYSGLGVGIGERNLPGGGISTCKGINLIFGWGKEGGLYWQTYWN